MKYVLPVLFVFISLNIQAQKKGAPVNYKTIHDRTFSLGDRIDMGEIDVVLLPLGKDSVVIPDSLNSYRRFIQQNNHITFKLHFVWKRQGVKYPGRSDRARDRILEYLNDNGLEQNPDCYVTLFHHDFLKQEPVLRLELEVLKVTIPNRMEVPEPDAVLPEQSE